MRVCNLPSDNFGYILLKIYGKVHFLASEVGDLHWVFMLGLELIDHDCDEANCQEEENGGNYCCLPDGIVFALRCSVTVGRAVDVAAAGVDPVAV